MSKRRFFRVCVSILATFMAGIWLVTAKAQTAPSVRVMTFNIHNYEGSFYYAERLFGIVYYRVGTLGNNPHWESIGLFRQRAIGWRLKRIVQIIEEQDPDIIGLQEAYEQQVDVLKTLLPRFKSVGRGRESDGGGETVSILYDSSRLKTSTVPGPFNMTLPETGTFWFSSSPDTAGSTSGGSGWGWHTIASWDNIPRIATWVGLETLSPRRKFYVYNVHLQNSSGATDANLHRVRSVKLLLKRVDEKVGQTPVIITGDFNAEPNDALIRHMTAISITTTVPIANTQVTWESPYRTRDAYGTLHPDVSGGTKCDNEGFPPKGDMGGRRIDYIFVSPASQVNIISANRVSPGENTMCPSDHVPVVSELGLLPALPRSVD